MKVRQERGSKLSIIPVDKLIREGYLLSDGKKLNGKWSKQKRQDYLRDNYGVDVESRQRKMVFFQLEKDTILEPHINTAGSHNYENIVIEEEIPLVKVIKKK
jgi:hypothetical protein